MCGIVAAVANRDVTKILTEGLRKLEYRGYDSCGIAVLQHGAPRRIRSVERIDGLEKEVKQCGLAGNMGIAHTRWATHGRPVTRNAHPIFSGDEIALVHNGIIENYEELRDELEAAGYRFDSDTDTEVIAHLIHHAKASDSEGSLLRSVQRCVGRLKGAYAIAVFAKGEPNRVIGARSGSPLIVGLDDRNGYFIASDALALVGTIKRYICLEEGDIVELSRTGTVIRDRRGSIVSRESRLVTGAEGSADLGAHRHYMQKEIFEQPAVLANTIGKLEGFRPALFGEAAPEVFEAMNSVHIIACGSSYYAGLVAKYWIESIAQVRANVEVASEFRYRESAPDPRCLVVAISQSGETADTLAALKHAKALGRLHTLAVCNVEESSISRAASLNYLTAAGPEIGVASTKAFTAQLLGLLLLALSIASARSRLSSTAEVGWMDRLRILPVAAESILALEPQIDAWAKMLAKKDHALFIGRGLHYPVALEGALKLKEISYVHAEAFPAGELKHGPLALVTRDMPVVAVVPDDELLDKLKSNIQEVRARHGEMFVFADAAADIPETVDQHVIRLPGHLGKLSPILHTIALQMLAYRTACARGTDVDKPRNLAKSVTVE
jgi:glucosamine--fructose-6-phosphate aminotransferase (isomerizing)